MIFENRFIIACNWGIKRSGGLNFIKYGGLYAKG